MDNNKIQLIGAPCGHHGQYTFYKAFKYNKNGKHKILALSDFFFVKLWSDSDLMSIGELQLLWMDRNTDQVLASLRLYFLPENTPEGRNDDHGEDEVLAISEKVVLRVEDLLDRISEDVEWCRGLTAIWEKDCRPPEPEGTPDDDTAQQLSSAGHHSNMIVSSALDFQDILSEKAQIVTDEEREHTSAVVVLSFPRYCRYRGIVKRLEGVTNKWLRNALVVALGGFAVPCRNTRILFCKDTFDYPDLEGHELLCNHLAPNLKARPRRKRKKRSVSPGGSESNESEESSSVSTASTITKSKPVSVGNGKNGLVQPRRSIRSNTPSSEEKEFLIKLHRFMKLRQTPIGRVPHLGFKEIDLFAFFTKVQKLGGYNAVTANRMWKPIYDDLGGHQGSTSAATCTRRHYERLLLPYEKSVNSDETNERRRSSNSQEDSPTKLEDVDVKPPVTTSCKNGVAPSSSLRSVRTKPDRSQQDGNMTQQPKDKENIPLLEMKPEPGSSGSERPTPELIDLVSEQDASTTKAPAPVLKKRKLDILKEGGLEVTAIAPPSTSIGSVTITADRRPSVIQHAAPAVGQVSITVTPDLSHMLGSPPTDLTSSSSTPSPTAGCDSLRQAQHVRSQTPSSNSSSEGWAPPRVVQSRSIYAHSEKTVYGNPKDAIEPPSSLLYRRKMCMKPAAVAAPPGGEVLDLRVSSARKPAISISRVSVASSPQNNVRNAVRLPQSKTNGVSPFPLIDGRAVVGSNLEITVVDVPKSSSALPQRQLHQQQQQRRPINVKPSVSARPVTNNKHGSLTISHIAPHRNNNAQLVIPSPYGSTSSSSRSRQQTPSAAPATPTSSSMPYVPSNSSLFPNFLSQLTSASGGGSTSKSASQYHLPLLDPVYYSALYGNPGLYPQSAAAFLSPPMFAPTAEQLQLYKELMNHHHGNPHFTSAGSSAIGSMLGLPRDGSTSITPIGRSSTPTSK